MRGLLSTLAVMALAPAGAQAARVGCAQQSFGTFPGGHGGGRTIGPLYLGDGYRDMSHVTRRDVREHGGYKAGVLLRPGHRATISIARRSRRAAGLAYGGRRDHTIRFVACADPGSSLNGRPIAFWPGAIVLRRWPACVRMTVRVDDRRPRRFRIPVGRSECS